MRRICESYLRLDEDKNPGDVVKVQLIGPVTTPGAARLRRGKALACGEHLGLKASTWGCFWQRLASLPDWCSQGVDVKMWPGYV